jgi:hypothetical protein
LRGRRTLEEGVPNVAAKYNAVVLTWRISDTGGDRFEEQEDGDEEKEEGGGVMIWGVREQQEQ